MGSCRSAAFQTAGSGNGDSSALCRCQCPRVTPASSCKNLLNNEITTMENLSLLRKHKPDHDGLQHDVLKPPNHQGWGQKHLDESKGTFPESWRRERKTADEGSRFTGLLSPVS